MLGAFAHPTVLWQSGTMNAVEQNLANWKELLLSSIPVGGLLSRNPVAYKWKAPFRVWELREAVFWRLHDLMTQSHALHQQGHGLGARILLRSGFELLAILIYLNQLMQQVLDGKLSFHAFGKRGPRCCCSGREMVRTGYQSINILTILQKCDKRYPGHRKSSMLPCPKVPIRITRAWWSVIRKIDHDEYETTFLEPLDGAAW